MSYVELFYPAVEHSSWIGSNHMYDSSYTYSYPRSYESSAVVLHVSMCCEKCVRKVKKALANVDDVESVEVDMQRQKVVVSGYPNPEKVLRKVRKVKKSATYWDSSHDYANYSTGAYDYQGPPSSSYDYTPSYAYDYNYRNPSSYDFSYNSGSSYGAHDYSRQNNREHRYSSYDAYRYL